MQEFKYMHMFHYRCLTFVILNLPFKTKEENKLHILFFLFFQNLKTTFQIAFSFFKENN